MVASKLNVGPKKPNGNSVPSNWTSAKICEIALVKEGIYGYRTENGTFKQLKADSIDNEGYLNADVFSRIKVNRSVDGYLLRRDDLIFNNRNSEDNIGKVAIYEIENGNFLFSNLLTRIRITSQKVLPQWIYYSLLHMREQGIFRSLSTRAVNQVLLKKSTLQNITIIFPKLDEQKKLVNTLSDMDSLIKELQKLIIKKKNIKQALKQTLLTKGIGHTKFKMTEIGEIPEEWKLGTLTSVTENENDIVAGPFGSNLKVSDYTNAGVPIIRLQNVAPNSFIFKDIKYIGEEKAKELNYHSFIAGDIVLAKLGDPIGVSCVIPPELPHGIVVSDVVRIRVSDKKVDKHFIVQSLNSSICLQQLRLAKIGSTRPRVNLSDVRNIKLILPALQEQQKIAEILSDTDKEIEALEQKRYKYKLLKMGMIQQLLTGRIRVK